MKTRAENESTWWEETFGGNTDSKPRGPGSVGMNISSIGYEYVFGIPGRAGTASVAVVMEPVMGIGRHCKVESQELEGVSWMDELG